MSGISNIKQLTQDNAATPSTKDSFSARFTLSNQGVFFKDDNDQQQFICSSLEVVAMTRDQDSQNYGRLLVWSDVDGNPHQWAMPMELVAGDGLELRKQLLCGGLTHIDSSARGKRLLMDYISTASVDERALCVTKTGWHGAAFVLPDTVIGEQAEKVILQTAENGSNIYRVQGNLEDWQQNVSRYCIGNSRLLFAASAAFGGPLLTIIGIDGCGFNFRGNSSEGKTTALSVATSVCGGPDFMNTWRATSNGLEGTAAHHNDGPLILDEMGQISPKEVGEVSYMISNGQGKVRASKTGNARAKKGWRVVLLSSGEISIEDHISSSGQKAKAGQMVRLADIPMSTGKYGGFEILHGFKGGGELSDHLRGATRKFHGAAFRVFLAAIYDKHKEIEQHTKQLQADFVTKYVPAKASGQVKRVANYFALVAAAGEIATDSGVTGWPQRASLDAAVTCFKAWLESHGGVQNIEDGQILGQVTAFFQKHGRSRFTSWGGTGSEKIIDRVGYIRMIDGEPEYYIFPQLFKTEICKGHDHKKALSLLGQAGLLINDNGRQTASQKPPGESGSMRFVGIRGKVIDGQASEP